LGDEIYHSFEEILVFEDVLALAVTEEDAHVDIGNLFAFLGECVGLVVHLFQLWLIAV
jgi:hypothetical protein